MLGNPVKISTDLYIMMREEDMGLCTTCRDFTTAGCEPDAEKYQCEECGKHTVYGAEQALIMGLIAFKEDDDAA